MLCSHHMGSRVSIFNEGSWLTYQSLPVCTEPAGLGGQSTDLRDPRCLLGETLLCSSPLIILGAEAWDNTCAADRNRWQESRPWQGTCSVYPPGGRPVCACLDIMAFVSMEPRKQHSARCHHLSLLRQCLSLRLLLPAFPCRTQAQVHAHPKILSFCFHPSLSQLPPGLSPLCDLPTQPLLVSTERHLSSVPSQAVSVGAPSSLYQLEAYLTRTALCCRLIPEPVPTDCRLNSRKSGSVTSPGSCGKS